MASDSTLRRWGVLGAALLSAGVAAGLGAVALRAALDLTTEVLLGSILRLEPIASGLWYAPAEALPDRRALLLPLLVAGGMMVTVAISRSAGPPVNGTDGVIHAVNTRELSGLTARGALVKLAGTAVTLGAGGSGGTEGPVVQVGASLGAALTRRFGLSAADASLVVVAAMGAGVGALFEAPLGGVILAGELLRRRGIGWTASAAALPTAPVAFGVYVAVYGYHPMFGSTGFGSPWNPLTTGLLVAVGVGCALVARLYVRIFHRLGVLLAPARKRPWLTAAVSGAVIGAVGIAVPMTLGTGYGVVSLGISPTSAAALPLWLLAVLPFVKIVSTAVTLHTGGVGGMFGPAMVIGASAGTFGWRLATDFGVDAGPVAVFTLTGLAACLGASVRAPLAAIVLAVEVAGYPIPPIGMVAAVLLAAFVTRDITLFPSQMVSAHPRVPPRPTVSVMLKTAAAWSNRTVGGPRPVRRDRLGPPREGCSMETETACGMPDLTDVPLEELRDNHHPDVLDAFRTALRRRAAAGIILAGFNGGGGA
ncbi:chloride channel protein [Nocardia paucivorans]|uniref:chloride channel protein n=1 Tax=Nocardia paucivorans TaxID=114259 RepID=UPI00059489AA|nr:chloride channel protein [Nocardia paucivorans]